MATISKIEIEGFKAFPNYFSLELGDKNLLMYGENGSGKSSIYYALHALLQSAFKSDKGAKYFKVVEDSSTGEGSIVNVENLVNVNQIEKTKKGEVQPYVRITLDNGNKWILNRGGLQSENSADESEIRMMNKNAVFINHSYISRFHAARNSEDIDLWSVFYKDILPFYLPAGKDYFLATKYDDIYEQSKSNPALSNKTYLNSINDFNDGLYSLINDANKTVSSIYNSNFKNIDEAELEIALCFYPDEATENEKHLPYFLFYGNERFGKKIQKGLYEPTIGILIKENGQEIYKPQTYFNEAKLTAIALAVRFACLNHFSEGEIGFMALDDMLISLDMSNRTKVINYLLNVTKYKIYLFTHDRAFFEHCKERIFYANKGKGLSQQKGWLFMELYNDDNPQNNPKEFNSESDVARAKVHYKAFDYPASANYLRKAVETLVRENFPPKLVRQDNGLEHDKLRNVLEASFELFQKIPGINLLDLSRLIGNLNLLLNPLSHKSTETNVYKTELNEIFGILERLRVQIVNLDIQEVLPRTEKIYLFFKENEHITQKYEIELQEELYSYQNGTTRAFCQLKAKSLNSCTITDGIEGDYVKNEHYKGSLEKICIDVHNRKGRVYANDYLDLYQDKNGNWLNTLI